MNIPRQHRKKKLCKEHREEQYGYALDLLIEGKADPNYATYRWHKVKQIRGK